MEPERQILTNREFLEKTITGYLGCHNWERGYRPSSCSQFQYCAWHALTKNSPVYTRAHFRYMLEHLDMPMNGTLAAV